MQEYKLGVGPMSHEINHIIDMYAEKVPLLVVASRNQVDYKSGYVCTTEMLPSFFSMRSNILLCRDHCGPYFSDKDKSLTLSEALEECKNTIAADIKAGFDLIHIDVSRIEHHQLEYAKELFDFALDLNPHIMFEFGSEDNTGEGLGPSLARIDQQLEFISKYKHNVKYFVTQTGSFTQHIQMGNFDIERNKQVLEKVHGAGFMFKEHNADYLNDEEVSKRRLLGIDALNIAPQLGTIQTRVLKDLACDNKEWYEFSKRVYDSNVWKKWLPKDVTNKDLAVIVAGHYHFNSIEYKRLMNTIDTYKFKDTLKKELFSVFDCYTKGLS
jgi:hypothetical protein